MKVQELIKELKNFDYMQDAKLNYVDWNNNNIPITAIKIYEQNGEVCFYLKSGSSIIG